MVWHQKPLHMRIKKNIRYSIEQATIQLVEFYVNWRNKTEVFSLERPSPRSFDGRWPLIEPTIDSRRPSMKDYLKFKRTFYGHCWTLREDNFREKTFFSKEKNFWWKTTFHGRQPFLRLLFSIYCHFAKLRPNPSSSSRWTELCVLFLMPPPHPG